MSDPTSCTRESSPENISFDVLGIASAMRSSGHRSSRRSLSARRFHRAGSCASRHRPAVLRPQLPENRCFAAAHQGEDSSTRSGAKMPLVTVLAHISSEFVPEPRSLPHGGPVVRWIRVRGRFFAVLEVSRVVSGRAGNAWEISMAVATRNSCCAIAETGERRERARIPRTGAVDLVRPGRSGALRLNKEVQ